MKKADLNCTGCLACVDVCPKKCITVIRSAEGFVYPKTNVDMCTNCGMCKKVCAIHSDIESKINKATFYAVKNKDRTVQMQSSSGGVFTAIAVSIIDNGGCVIGGVERA